MTLLGIISDVHSNLEALTAVLLDMQQYNLDKIISAGDIVGYNTNPNEVIELFKKYAIESVLGNHDGAVIGLDKKWEFNEYVTLSILYTQKKITKKNKEFLKQLPLKKRFEYNNKKILMVHGSPYDPLQEYVNPYSTWSLDSIRKSDENVFIMGHTHEPYTVESNWKLLINPGSVGQPRDKDPRASYVILDTNTWKVMHHRVKYDIEITANKTKTIHKLLADRLFVGE